MNINLLPEGVPRGVHANSLPGATLPDRIASAHRQGFGGIVLDASGTPYALHAPSLSPQARLKLRNAVAGFAQVAVIAPSQETYDLTLVSPSAAIRRASLAELWSTCRFAEALGEPDRKTVMLVRVGAPPASLETERHREYLRESLHVLNRTAGDHNTLIGLWNRDYFADLDDFGLLEMLPSQNLRVALHHAASPYPGEMEKLSAFLRWGANRLAYVEVAHGDLLPPPLFATKFTGMVCYNRLSDVNLAVQ